MTSPAMVSPFPTKRQAPAGWAYLDYPGAGLVIQATTKWERKLRAEACRKEPWTVAWLESMPAGAVLWNVGANVGSYALIAAHLGHPVVALEPGYASYAALCNNVLANRLERLVTPICAAVGEGSGIVPLAYRSTEAGAASHGFGQAGGPKLTATLPTLTVSLDALAALPIPKPTHILIDVDGAEPAVLAGAPALLSAHAPSLMVEVQHTLAEGIANMLTAWGYAERERFDERDGLPLAGIWYAVWERPA